MSKKNLVAVRETNKTLPEIVAEAQRIIQALTESYGELSPELERSLDMNKMALAEKLDRYAFVDEKLQSEASFWKTKADVYRKIASGCENARERLRENIKRAMGELGKDEVKGVETRYVLVKMKDKLVLDQPEQLPPDFKMVIQSSVPDKEKIAFALKEGFEVPGAHLEPVVALRTYENNE